MMVYTGHAPESVDDERYDYHWAVLRAALDLTGRNGAITSCASRRA